MINTEAIRKRAFTRTKIIQLINGCFIFSNYFKVHIVYLIECLTIYFYFIANKTN
jgi:hypothetical protein